jgi:hypothetical protein
MPEKAKKDKLEEKPTEQQAAENPPPPAPKELTREQLEELRRKLQKKFH